MKTALLTGTTGQDGSYLTEYLLERGYKVVATVPQRHELSSVVKNWRKEGLFEKNLELAFADMTDSNSLDRVVEWAEPDEVYNLAAQSFVGSSWDLPEYTYNVNMTGVVRLLDACKKYAPEAKIYQASTSEMFGKSTPKQNENTPFAPCSPYAAAKVAAHKVCQLYRDQGLHVSCGILFNHESPRRGLHFVTQKIVKTAVIIRKGYYDRLELGNPDAYRDWGHAKEYVEFMHKICNHDVPDDFVVGTGVMNSVRDFVEITFKKLHLDVDEHVSYGVGCFMRPNDVPLLLADTTKLENTFGSKPQIGLHELIDNMIDHWMERIPSGMDNSIYRQF